MIVFEDGIQELVDQIPTIQGFKSSFHWGDQNELTRWLKLQEQPYPLIWLLTGSENHDLRGPTHITRDCKFILAVRNEEESELNNVRLRGSYDEFLTPLADRLIEGLTKFRRTKINNQKFTFQKHPHYVEYQRTGSKQVNYTVDYWDAATIDVSVKMNTNAKNTIVWQNV